MDKRQTMQLAEWFERCNKSLKRFLGRRLHQHIDAEDLAQEVYLRLLRIKDLDAIKEPQAYLYYVARNIAAEWYARARQTRTHGQEELDELIELTTPESLANEYTEGRAFNEALQPLPAAVRAVIYLKLRDGKSHEEIAQHLGIKVRMVRKHLSSGYAILRRRLIKE